MNSEQLHSSRKWTHPAAGNGLRGLPSRPRQLSIKSTQHPQMNGFVFESTPSEKHGYQATPSKPTRIAAASRIRTSTTPEMPNLSVTEAGSSCDEDTVDRDQDELEPGTPLFHLTEENCTTIIMNHPLRGTVYINHCLGLIDAELRSLHGFGSSSQPTDENSLVESSPETTRGPRVDNAPTTEQQQRRTGGPSKNNNDRKRNRTIDTQPTDADSGVGAQGKIPCDKDACIQPKKTQKRRRVSASGEKTNTPKLTHSLSGVCDVDKGPAVSTRRRATLRVTHIRCPAELEEDERAIRQILRRRRVQFTNGSDRKTPRCIDEIPRIEPLSGAPVMYSTLVNVVSSSSDV